MPYSKRTGTTECSHSIQVQHDVELVASMQGQQKCSTSPCVCGSGNTAMELMLSLRRVPKTFDLPAPAATGGPRSQQSPHLGASPSPQLRIEE
mmetsp:Transcript_69001/g.128890  ORF Transcript_69001/g.128890 Transcript_69001/m.128890 type:complete len:93 (-) Transcript_69001:1311-1589(-)